MTAQSDRIGALVHAHAETFGWMELLERALAAEPALDDATVAMLVDRARPRWGVRSPDEARAYVTLWERLVATHSVPALRAGFADVLYLLGDAERACEALRIFADAVAAQPALFIEYSADFSDLAEGCGGEHLLAYRVAMIRYYAWLVDRDELETAELQQAVADVLAEFPSDPDLRRTLAEIAFARTR